MPKPTEINVLAELERIGVAYEWSTETRVSVICPFHDDNSPSLSIDIERRSCKCFSCDTSTDFVGFLARKHGEPRTAVLKELSSRYNLSTDKVINAETVERYHKRIWAALPLLKELTKRGVDEELIRKYRLGEDRGRITIPIKNNNGYYVNVRRYLPGAPGKDKMKNTRGHGSARLWPPEQMQYKQVVLCGGEMKAVVAARELNPYGIGAVCSTGGETNWEPSLTHHFKDLHVWVCLDVDLAGQNAARDRCNLFSRVASWVGNVVLPLDTDKHPKGDINDFIATEGGKLHPVLEACPEWQPEYAHTLDDSEPVDVSLSQACSAERTGKRVRVQAVVTAMDQAPYVIPKTAKVSCDKDQNECAICPVYLNQYEGDIITIPDESQAILAMVGTKDSLQREAIMKATGIPKRCRVVDFEPQEFYEAEDVRLSPRLEITNRATDRVMQPAVCIGHGLELNETYELTGRMHPDPDNQQATLVVSDYKTSEDALSSYKPNNLETLDIFRPTEWTEEAIGKKLGHLYEDFAANVTRIFQRESIHLITDLVYHSPLWLRFDDREVKGWVEALVVGDSSQGKSETTANLKKHYGLGEKLECKNATVAGLLGGLQQLGGQKWFVTWGIIPTHDKRLVILEEVKGASTEVIGKLTDMRSSGIAELDKIEKRRTLARTRLLALSNPRSDCPISSYNFGVETIPELIGGLEDVRRFDAFLIVAAQDVDSEKLNQYAKHRPIVEHVHTSELCRSLILWGWTREGTQVQFDTDAEELILDEATKLCQEYTDSIPIVDRGSMRLKLARLAAALACRTFSTTEDRLTLRIRKCHVEFICSFLRKTYSSTSFGYDRYTAAVKMTQELKDPDEIKHQLTQTPYPKDLIDNILHTARIEVQDVQDWCAWDRQTSLELVSFLVRKRALQRDGRAYRKTSRFIELLKQWLTDGVADRPDFMPDSTQEF